MSGCGQVASVTLVFDRDLVAPSSPREPSLRPSRAHPAPSSGCGGTAGAGGRLRLRLPRVPALPGLLSRAHRVATSAEPRSPLCPHHRLDLTILPPC